MLNSFQQSVLKVVRKIPRGQVLTYQQVAKRAGRPKAYRAVGNILRTNHNPAIPCHRVVRADGSVGGYNRGQGQKRALLMTEGALRNWPISKRGQRRGKILPASWFNRPTLLVAKELLGKYLVRQFGKKRIALMITEVEAYDGPYDRASHAHRGQTKRNAPMFGQAGRWYVYLVYGNYWMLNIVTGPKNYPAAVLLRGAGEISGPGRLAKHLHITGGMSGRLANRNFHLWIEDRGVRIKNTNIKRTSRIGVAYAGRYWSNRPYRFILPAI